MCQLDLKLTSLKLSLLSDGASSAFDHHFLLFLSNFLVFPVFLGPCDSVLLQIPAVLSTRRFGWLLSIWFPYIAKVCLEKIFLSIFPSNRIKALSRFSALIYLFLLAVEGTSNGIHGCGREGSPLLGRFGAAFSPKLQILPFLPP